MTYNELALIIGMYDIEKYKINDFERFYFNCDVINYYIGYDWYLGLLYINCELCIYFRQLRHKIPKFVIRWKGSEKDFNNKMYSRCEYPEDPDENIFRKIMEGWPSGLRRRS